MSAAAFAGGHPESAAHVAAATGLYALLRLFLTDVPDGLSMDTLAIAVMSAAYFEDAVSDAAPVIESIEFHPPG